MKQSSNAELDMLLGKKNVRLKMKQLAIDSIIDQLEQFINYLKNGDLLIEDIEFLRNEIDDKLDVLYDIIEDEEDDF